MTKELKKFNTKITKNVILTILLIAPLFVSGIAVNQYVYATCDDADNDTFCDINSGGDDCDDTDPNVNPGATESDNGVDDNCDGNIDEGFDGDSDGFTPIFGGDCDDTDPAINPDATEIAGDGIDQDCDGFDNPQMVESQQGDFWKSIEQSCIDGLDISSGAPQSCNIWITIHSALDGTFVDSIPAHLVVDSVTADMADCDDGEFANAHGKSKNNSVRVTSSTIVTCDIDQEDVGTMIHIETHTRGSPSNEKSNNPNHVDKWSPTGCGLFEVNGGIIYFEALDQFGIPIVLDSIDPVFVHTTPDDLDCDGVDNATDQCSDTLPGTEVDSVGCPLV